jgi:NAD(P)-dependent dehydrogenase (short-subunit alcohol dehydrogenase family)
VLLSDVNDAALSKAVELVRSNFPSSQAVGMRCDVSKEADVQALLDTALAHWDRLDVMVRVSASVRSTTTDLPSSTMRG